MPASPASTLTLVTRDGVTITLECVLQESYSADPRLADDQATPYAEEIKSSGSAIIDAGSLFATFQSALAHGGNRLSSATLTVDSVTAWTLSSDTDDRGGPFCRLNATSIEGINTVFLEFSITGVRSTVGTQTLTAHRWTQRFALDATGRSVRTINGAIHVARGTTATATTVATNAAWTGKAAYADLFRAAAIPDPIGPGWRRETQDFALDDTSTMLLYTIIDRQTLTDLPDGVRVGDMQFDYEVTLENAAQGLLTFSCTLEGDLGLASITGTTGNRRLVEIAVALSKARINATYKTILITRLRVSEIDILTGYKIRFELEALSIPQNSGTLTTVPDLLGQKFTIVRTLARTIDPYGAPFDAAGGASPVGYGMIPHFLSNNVTGLESTASAGNLPRAATFTIAGVNAYGAVSVTIVLNAAGTTEMNAAFNGGFASAMTQPAVDVDGYTTLVHHSLAVTDVRFDTGIVRLSPMYLTAPDLLFQTSKPTPVIREIIRVVRANQAPAQVFRVVPTGAYLKSEKWKVTYGKLDPQGQRIFTGVYEREIALYDLGGATPSNGFFSQATPGGANVRAWKAPNQTLLATLTQLATSASQETTLSVIGTPTNPKQSYSVPVETFVT